MSHVKFCINYSDWLIIWFILYKFKIINYNPKFSILLGIIYNFSELIKDLITKKLCFKRYYITLFIHFIIKITELYFLLDTPFTISDFKFNLLIFIIFNIWVTKVLKKPFKLLNINDIFNNKQKNLEDYSKINKIKLDKLNNEYKNEFENINKKYIIQLKKFNKTIDQNKIDKILYKYKNKIDKIYNNYENNFKHKLL